MFFQNRFSFPWTVKRKLRNQWLDDVDRDLAYAVYRGYHNTVSQLIPHASPQAKDLALWQASFAGDQTLQMRLLENNADPQARWDGLLCRSASKGDIEGIHFALHQGGNLHAHNDLPLFLAASNGHENATHELIRLGSEVHRAFNVYSLQQCKESQVNNAKAMDIVEWFFLNKQPMKKPVGFELRHRVD